MKFLSLKSNLANTFYPMILLEGKDYWVKNRAVDYIKASLDIAYSDINIARFANCNDFSELMRSCNTFPFASNQKLVVVEGLSLTDEQRDKVVKELDLMASSEDTSCCLVINCNEKDSKYLEKCKTVTRVDCNKLSESDIVKWILATCKANEKSIQNSVASLLTKYCLCDMSRISSELEKLINYCKEEIDIDSVELMVNKDMEYIVFDLGTAIADGNIEVALDILTKLVKQRTECSQLFAVLYNYYRRLYYMKTSSMTDKEIAERLGVKPGAIAHSKYAAAKYKSIHLRRAIKYLEQAESKLKNFTSDVDSMRLLVIQLASIR